MSGNVAKNLSFHQFKDLASSLADNNARFCSIRAQESTLCIAAHHNLAAVPIRQRHEPGKAGSDAITETNRAITADLTVRSHHDHLPVYCQQRRYECAFKAHRVPLPCTVNTQNNSGRSGKTHGEMIEEYIVELKRQNDLIEKMVQDQEARLQRLESTRRSSSGGSGGGGSR